MRAYKDKTNVQKKSYYNDRFHVTPSLPKLDVSEDEVFAKDLATLQEVFEISEAYIQADQLVFYIDASKNKEAIIFLKEQLAYEHLSEMGAIDWLAKRGEYEVFYQMLSMEKRKRLRMKLFVKEKVELESISMIFRCADWSEREMYDMSGVRFKNHPYMKRILMPDDWYDHPLKKTYPLHGDEAAQWYEVDKIFGKEARDIIGPELRDSAQIDRYDTTRFARLGHEVQYGEDISKGEPHTPLGYQEDKGVFLVQELDEEKAVVIKDRDR